MFKYTYMQYALITGLFLGAVLPLIGIVLINRNTPILGDALSHISLAGVIAGILLGINPILGALVFSLLAALSMESIRKRFPSYGELSTAIILSAGVGTASVLSGFITSGQSYEGFLFGSIVSISKGEVFLVVAISILVSICFYYYYYELLYISVDSESAKIAGIKVEKINFLFTLMTALVISVASRIVGVLLISSLIIIPVASSMAIAKSYRDSIIIANIIGIIDVFIGLTLAYYLGLKPGGAIVMTGIFVFLITLIIRRKM